MFLQTTNEMRLRLLDLSNEENVVVNVEFAGLQHFLLLSQCFHKASFETLKLGGVWYAINSLPDDKILTFSKRKALADVNFNETQMMQFFFDRGSKHCGERRKCWLLAFSPFPTMFSKGLFFRIVKTRDCLGKR